MVVPRHRAQSVTVYRQPLREHATALDSACVVALKALGETTRARIVGLLIDAPLDVGAIAKRVGVTQYNVSKHLRVLREAGLLELQKTGRRHLYAVTPGLRDRTLEDAVLNLGCCSFRFERSGNESAPSPAPRRRPRRGDARAGR